MSGIKGFSVITIAFLIVAFLFIGIGRGQELTDEEFEKQYREELIHEINIPIDIITRVHIKDEKHMVFEDIRSPHLLTDIFKDDTFSVFFGYTESTTEKLRINRIVLDKTIIVEFLQDDDTFKHREGNKSFVVFPLNSQITKTGKNTTVEIYFEDNKMGIIKKEFTIFSTQIDKVFYEIRKWFKEKEGIKPKMVV